MMAKTDALSREEARAIDRWAAEVLGLPTLVLMENAGRGAAEWLRELSRAEVGPVVVACGLGNNGGDGGVVARHLHLWGVSVRVVWFGRWPESGDASVQRRALSGLGISQTLVTEPDQLAGFSEELASAGWVVDALLGTGLDRPVEGLMRGTIEAINRSGRPVLALDLPSGLDADFGQPLGLAVRARATATFAAPKLGFLAAEAAADYVGEVKVIDIGVPARVAKSGGSA